MDEIVEKLKSIGLNSYEAKIYLALLKKSPATGYEAAKLANIPQSRAYDTLKALEAAQIVIVSSEKPQTFTPVRPKDLTKRFKRKFDMTIDFLEKKLPNVKEMRHEPVLHIDGTEKIIKKVTEIARSAKKEIFFSVHRDDYRYIEPALREAYKRGVEVKGDYTQKPPAPFLLLSADEVECVYARTKDTALWTKNSDLVFLIKEFIKQKARGADL